MLFCKGRGLALLIVRYVIRDRKPMWFSIVKDSAGAAWDCPLFLFFKIYLVYDFVSSRGCEPILTTMECSHSPTNYASRISPGDLGLFVL